MQVRGVVLAMLKYLKNFDFEICQNNNMEDGKQEMAIKVCIYIIMLIHVYV